MDDTALRMVKLRLTGYCCAQIIMKMALEEEDRENEDLVRAVSALCFGAGSGQKICGVLTACIAVFGLYAGKGSDTERPKPGFSEMADAFTDWFTAEFGSTECRDIIGVCSITDYNTNQSYALKCGDILEKSYYKTAEILQKFDFEFGNRDAS